MTTKILDENSKHAGKNPCIEGRDDKKRDSVLMIIQDDTNVETTTTTASYFANNNLSERNKLTQVSAHLVRLSLILIVVLGTIHIHVLISSNTFFRKIGNVNESPQTGYNHDSFGHNINANSDSKVESAARARTLATSAKAEDVNQTTSNVNAQNSVRRPNVLLFIVDDLKPMFSAYKSPLLPARGTPNIDRIIQNGVSFMNAHAQMSVCGPSRASFLTSLRPDTLQVYKLRPNSLRDAMARLTKKTKKEVLTLPKLFRQAGYHVYGVGKIFHENELGLMQNSDIWTAPLYSWVKFKKNEKPSISDPSVGLWISSPNVPDDALPDGQVAKIAVNLLRNTLATNASVAPFFLTLGLYRPHLPWIAPKKYFDMCAPITEYHGAYYTGLTKGLSNPQAKLAKGRGCIETHVYKKGPRQLHWPNTARIKLQNANRAYHASVLYIDAQIGLVLDALEESPARDNTIIVFMSDHGFHLGDKGLYCKKTNYEQATKVPFIISVPRQFDSRLYPRNAKAYAPVELLDLMPTLYDLASLDVDKNKYYSWQGESLVPMIRNPSNTYVKQAAVSQYFRKFKGSEHWGYTIRTVRYRYTRWYLKEFEELYDYLEDAFERISLHSTKRDLKSLLLKNGYYDKDFPKGAKLVPFDFEERFKMESMPPSKFA